MATADVIAPLATDLNPLTFELQDVQDDQIETEIWLEANPDLALALLSDEEVESLAAIVQKSAEIAGHLYQIDKTFDLVRQGPTTLSVRIVGAVDLSKSTIDARTFFRLTIHTLGRAKIVQIKGPNLQGSLITGVHVGPVRIGLPSAGLLDIWVKSEGRHLVFTFRIVFSGRTVWKRFDITLPISPLITSE